MGTMMEDSMFSATLADILQERGVDAIYPCILDLLENGLDQARFGDGEAKPQRQEITQYLAAWSKHVGLEKEECQNWLIEYCMAMLSSISKTSPSGIRHSTKSNIKYIYKYDIEFFCKNEDNPFKARCGRDCPAYVDMMAKAFERRNKVPKDFAIKPSAEVTETQFVSVKEIYRDQFETALKLIDVEMEKKTKKKNIVRLLNEQGLKTRTGRKWTYGILFLELKKRASDVSKGA